MATNEIPNCLVSLKPSKTTSDWKKSSAGDIRGSSKADFDEVKRGSEKKMKIITRIPVLFLGGSDHFEQTFLFIFYFLFLVPLLFSFFWIPPCLAGRQCHFKNKIPLLFCSCWSGWSIRNYRWTFMDQIISLIRSEKQWGRIVSTNGVDKVAVRRTIMPVTTLGKLVQYLNLQ